MSNMTEEEYVIREKMLRLYWKYGRFARLDIKEVDQAHEQWLKLKYEADLLARQNR